MPVPRARGLADPHIEARRARRILVQRDRVVARVGHRREPGRGHRQRPGCECACRARARAFARSRTPRQASREFGAMAVAVSPSDVHQHRLVVERGEALLAPLSLAKVLTLHAREQRLGRSMSRSDPSPRRTLTPSAPSARRARGGRRPDAAGAGASRRPLRRGASPGGITRNVASPAGKPASASRRSTSVRTSPVSPALKGIRPARRQRAIRGSREHRRDFGGRQSAVHVKVSPGHHPCGRRDRQRTAHRRETPPSRCAGRSLRPHSGFPSSSARRSSSLTSAGFAVAPGGLHHLPDEEAEREASCPPRYCATARRVVGQRPAHKRVERPRIAHLAQTLLAHQFGRRPARVPHLLEDVLRRLDR